MSNHAAALAGIAAFFAAAACAIVAVSERDYNSPSALLQLAEIPTWAQHIAYPSTIVDKAFKYSPVYSRNFYPISDPTGDVAGYIKVGTVGDDFNVYKDKGYSRGDVYVDAPTLEKHTGPAYLKIGDISGEAYDKQNGAAYIKYDGLQPAGGAFDPATEPYPGAGSYLKITNVQPLDGANFHKIGDIKGQAYSGAGYLKIGDIKGE